VVCAGSDRQLTLIVLFDTEM